MRAGHRLAAAAVALSVSMALSGCAPARYDPVTSVTLQSDVLDVSRAAANGDWAGASAGLDGVVADAQQAADAGRIDADRLESILAAVAAVRADLHAETTVSPPPKPSPHHGKGPKH